MMIIRMLLQKQFPLPILIITGKKNLIYFILLLLDTARSQEKEGEIVRLCNQVELPFSGRPIFSRQIVGIRKCRLVQG